MKTKIVAFSGDKRDDYGMPVPFHIYAIFVSAHPSYRSHFNLTTMSFSHGTATDIEGSRLLHGESEDEVLQLAIAQLKEHPNYKELAVQVSDIPSVHL